MENADLIVDLEQRLVAVLQNEDASLSPRSTEGRARAEVLEEFRSWRKEVSLTRLAMQSERQRYRELLEMVSQGYLRTDLEGVIYEASDAAAALLDTPVESLCGRPLASFVAGDERQDFCERVSQFLRTGGGGVQQWQSTLQPSGRPGLAASFLIFPWRDPEGGTTGLCWLLYDLTDRSETIHALQIAELEHRALIEGMNDMLFVVDPEGQFTYVSPAVERIGFYKAHEVTGEHLSCFVHPEDLARVLANLEHATASYGETYSFRILRKDGAVVHLRVRSRTLVREGQVLGIACMAADVTAQKQHERELLAVVNIAAALRVAPNLAEMLPIIVEQGLQLLQAQGACLALCEAKREEAVIATARDAWSHWEGLRFASGEGPIGHVIATGEPFRNADGLSDGAWARSDLLNGLPAVACFPLVTQEQTIGALVAGRELAFTDGDLRILAVLAEIAANAIHRASQHEQTRQLNSQLEKRERFIARIVDSIPSSLLVVDRALRIVSVNRNFEEKTRRDARTLVGRPLEEILPPALWDYTRLDQKVSEVFRLGQAVEGGRLAYRTPNAPTRIYYYRCIPLMADDETVENVMLLMDDITERERLGEEIRRAERHLASVVECANDLVISTDARGSIVTCNRATESTLRRSNEEIRGVSLAAFCVPEQKREMDELLGRLGRGELVRSFELELLTSEKQRVPIAWSLSPMLDDAGKLVGVVTVGRDLTERRQLESQLVQSAKMASLGVMAGGIAHELRNPLGVVSASAQLLLEFADDPELASQCAEKIWAATQRASLIIENLLRFARPQREQASDLDLNVILETALDVLANQLALHQITLQKHLQADLPRAYGNPALLEQVFANLALNACNAMSEGGTLEVSSRAGAADKVEIRFRDTGCGILPENLPKIFDPFFTTMPVGQGVGLGLSLCYSIIQQQQGEINVESEVGQGTTFTVRLPTSRADVTSA